MKGLSSSRNHHQVISYEPSYDPLGHHVDHKSYVFSQMEMPVPISMPHPAELSCYNVQHALYPSNNSIVPYGTFPRRCHSTSSSHHPEVKDECMAIVPYVGGVGRGEGGVGGYGGKAQSQVPVNFMDPCEQQLPFSRDGYHTLQYKREIMSQSGGMVPSDNNNDSPGRIRHLVHSVQKLFTKSHSLEGPYHTQSSKGANNGSVNGGGGGGGGGGGSRASPEGATPQAGVHHRKRSKSRERCRSAEPKHRSYHHHHHPQLHGSASAPGSGYWSSDDNLERELCLYHPHHHQPHPSPSFSISPSPVAMSMVQCHGNNPDKYPQTLLTCLPSSQSQQYVMADPYGTLNDHTCTHACHGHMHHSALKASRSNSNMKYAASSACVPVSGSSNNRGGGLSGGSGQLLPLGLVDRPLEKKGAWSSSLKVSRTREVYSNNNSHNQLQTRAGSGNLNLDKALVKAKSSQQQNHSCHFLQVNNFSLIHIQKPVNSPPFPTVYTFYSTTYFPQCFLLVSGVPESSVKIQTSKNVVYI